MKVIMNKLVNYSLGMFNIHATLLDSMKGKRNRYFLTIHSLVEAYRSLLRSNPLVEQVNTSAEVNCTKVSTGIIIII